MVKFPFLTRGEPFALATAAALVLALASVAGVAWILASRGLAAFWPRDLVLIEAPAGKRILGEPKRTEPAASARGLAGGRTRTLYRTGNRKEAGGTDFVWVDDDVPGRRSMPEAAVLVERREWGPAIGFLNEARPDGGLALVLADGRAVEVPAPDVVRIVRPNALGFAGRLRVAGARFWEFLTAEPRESNTEGGIAPAILGTVLLVLLMTVAVVPLGVVAAVYLREIARDGPLVRLVRLAVANLAGVPSIVFGMFGLAFFVYGMGGWIDRAFFPDRLPSPTFGTGGLLWSSLTLALLTVPVVIVATEESIQAVPRAQREGSLALGATIFQTIRRVVLPAALPGILTGAILAIARATGEVAPLMMTGVVKLAPDPLVSGTIPYLHLDRQFMHLGFHIYDVGFQSPNVEAAKPMVYATAFLLLVLVVTLNLAAIAIRNRVRRRLQGGVF